MPGIAGPLSEWGRGWKSMSAFTNSLHSHGFALTSHHLLSPTRQLNSVQPRELGRIIPLATPDLKFSLLLEPS